MMQQQTTFRRIISGVGQLLSMAWRWGAMGVLMVLPFLTAVGQDTSQSLVTQGTGAGMGSPKHVAPGDLDTGFGSNGKVRTHFQGVVNDRCCAVALQPDGKIVAAGTSNDGTHGYAFALAGYRSNGSLDTTFGDHGTVTTRFGNGTVDQASALTVQPRDGRIVVAGISIGPDLGAIALARYHAFTLANEFVTLDGAPETAFAPTPVPGGPAGTFTIRATFTNTSVTPCAFPSLP
jgi:uncharacterized delta-60 repeat protein